MRFDQIIVLLMTAFLVLGGIDRIFGSRLKLGTAFENGIRTMGELALSMLGIMVLAPVIADVLTPVVTPVFTFLGADPAIFAGAILACDMGGAPLAAELAATPEAAKLGGLIVASTLGGTISFTIPFSMSALQEKDRPYAAKGILCGVVTLPIGIFVGGLAAGFPIGMVALNCVPVVIISLLIALGLWKVERILIKAFVWFGKFITAVATVGLVAAGVQSTTGLVLIKNLASVEESIVIVGQIAIVLAGAFPLIAVLTRVLKKPFGWIGKLMGVNDTAVSGLVASLANSIAAIDMVKDMDRRGKIVNMAFGVSGAFVFGDHLAFTAGFDAEMIPSLIVGKLVGGITAVALALLVTTKEKTAE